jgi:toxin ParE1/3/4
MAKFVLSPQAQKSLKQIQRYTFENYGKQQTSLYLNGLRKRMQQLAESPFDGKPRSEIKTDYYSYYEGRHTIYYRIRDTHIDIIDILHQSMEPDRHL